MCVCELWRPVEGFEGYYEVSNTGKVKSLDRVDARGRLNKGKLKSQCNNGRGYMCVNLKVDGKQKQKSVHRLVAIAFIPNPNNLPEVNHIDGDKTNNNTNNLEWCTPSYNKKHAFKTGLNRQHRGINNPYHKLSKEDVLYIRKYAKPYDKSFSYAQLARKFNVSEMTIKNVVWRKSYVSIF